MWGVRVIKKSGKEFFDMCKNCYAKEEEHTNAAMKARIFQKPFIISIDQCNICGAVFKSKDVGSEKNSIY